MSRFVEEYGRKPQCAVFAPGRVNLIGEHVDYNDGFVLPFALPFRTIIVGDVVRSSNHTSRVTSCNIIPTSDNTATFTCDSTLSKGQPTWANYVKGVVYQYLNDLPPGAAFEAVIMSDVPIGSGLSSSASLEVATATFLEVLYKLDTSSSIPGMTKAKRCQLAEHTFADMPCGIMDQSVSAMAHEGSLLLLDCRTNDFQLITVGSKAPPGTPLPAVVICNSNVKHTLSGSEYPDRVRQCNEAVAALQEMHSEIKALRDATIEQLEALNKRGSEKHKTAVPHSGNYAAKVASKDKVRLAKKASSGNLRKQQEQKVEAGGGPKAASSSSSISEVAYQRAHHCISEDCRTIRAARALEDGNYEIVGDLMTQSHLSLQFDYEVSCSELDLLVCTALKVPGVYGSRMTGGGFGGCTVNLVKADCVDELISQLKQAYPACDCYLATPSAGADELPLDSAMAVMTGSVSRYGDSVGDNDSDNDNSEDWLSTRVDDVLLSMIDNPWLTAASITAAVAVVGMILIRRNDKFLHVVRSLGNRPM